MTQAAETVSAQAVKLPPAERMQVAERILDSLDEPDATLDAAWAAEAEDRLATNTASPGTGVTDSAEYLNSLHFS